MFFEDKSTCCFKRPRALFKILSTVETFLAVHPASLFFAKTFFASLIPDTGKENKL